MNTAILRSLFFFSFFLGACVSSCRRRFEQAISNYLSSPSRNAQPPARSPSFPHSPHFRSFSFHSQKKLFPLSLSPPLYTLRKSLLHSYSRTHHLCIHRVRRTNFLLLILLSIKTFDLTHHH